MRFTCRSNSHYAKNTCTQWGGCIGPAQQTLTQFHMYRDVYAGAALIWLQKGPRQAISSPKGLLYISSPSIKQMHISSTSFPAFILFSFFNCAFKWCAHKAEHIIRVFFACFKGRGRNRRTKVRGERDFLSFYSLHTLVMQYSLG